ncbi:MAG: serine/threonine-protein kinase [Rhodothermales bacterium]|nr:serine/threonine-protein kinase [Rhodothermales bacterium]
MTHLDPERWQRIEAVLDQALDIPPDARDAFLDEACAGDDALRQHVEAMLAAGDAGTFLDDPDGEHLGALLDDLQASTAQEEITSFVGRRIGVYKLLRPIGRGGMGQVFLAARDDDTFRQHVALKIIRRGMDSEDILQRFRTERQILASLNHPNIARLLDGGVSEEGLSYFVMEYIDGQPIMQYCDQHRLSVSERLQLFLKVGAAVHYAHQNLVVHRDLKPSNILVTAEGVPKLLDFGIAKLLNPNLPGYTVPLTRTEMRVMTPEYASPEQVRGETVTTASDVYALGVLLYELLTGHRPHRLFGRAPAEIERAICETDPERPSTAVGRTEEQRTAEGLTTTVSPETVGRARGVPMDRLRRRLEGDLDTIVLMALRKEPDRRYQSVEALTEDVRRHLAGLPVNARRPTLGYRARKFVRRHRVGVTATALLTLLFVVTTVLSIRYAIVTSAQSERITLEAAKNEQVRDFLVSLFQVSDPQHARGREITALELLERGADQVENQLADQPVVQAEMLHVMGVVYRQLGLLDEARPLLERALTMRRAALGERHEDVAQSLYDLAWLLDEQGEYDEARLLHQQALELRLALLGPDHPDVAQSRSDYGIALFRLGDYDGAEAQWREALSIQRERLGEENEVVLELMSNLAIALHEGGHYDEAEALYRDVLTLQPRVVGADHPEYATNLQNLGSFLYDRGAYAEAEALLRQAAALRRKLFGEDHHLYGNTLSWLGRTLHRQGALDEGEAVLRRALALHTHHLGTGHSRTARDAQMLGALLIDRGDLDGAVRQLEAAMEGYSGSLPPDHPLIGETELDLGRAYLLLGRPADAEPMLRAAHATLRAARGPEDAGATRAQLLLGLALSDLGRTAEALPSLRDALTRLPDSADDPLVQRARRLVNAT